ncbi:MAG: hypothetical protein EXQ91_06930 [Alphaproteobacteria bacterium]|nr:hypothetical protein [Alphaproteobacteria bacterium]
MAKKSKPRKAAKAKINPFKGRSHDRGKVTPETLIGSIAARRVADHPWLKALAAGQIAKNDAARVAKHLVYLFDNLIEVYGPMYLNNADYKVRRIFVNKMLKSITLNDGSKLRVGEGAQAELCADLARSLGANIGATQDIVATPLLKEKVAAFISSLERPPYWVTLGASAAVESQMKAVYKFLRAALRTHFGVSEANLRVFSAPALFDRSDITHCLSRCDDIFDKLKIAYYTERLRNEWYDMWEAAFSA